MPNRIENDAHKKGIQFKKVRLLVGPMGHFFMWRLNKLEFPGAYFHFTIERLLTYNDHFIGFWSLFSTPFAFWIDAKNVIFRITSLFSIRESFLILMACSLTNFRWSMFGAKIVGEPQLRHTHTHTSRNE